MFSLFGLIICFRYLVSLFVLFYRQSSYLLQFALLRGFINMHETKYLMLKNKYVLSRNLLMRRLIRINMNAGHIEYITKRFYRDDKYV